MSEDTDTGRQTTHTMDVLSNYCQYEPNPQIVVGTPPNHSYQQLTHGSPPIIMNAAFPSSLHGSLINPQHKLGTGLETEHGFSSKYRHVDVDLEP
ncbi:hypothetical protein SUGI_0009110 [Cryptomeria japonica]|nr:hypothetical protein SUGI_0009110 [Cryptomeria japonica]